MQGADVFCEDLDIFGALAGIGKVEESGSGKAILVCKLQKGRGGECRE